jgi:hypothetical protein
MARLSQESFPGTVRRGGCPYEGKTSILRICGEDRQLGGEAAVVHFEDGFDHVGDVLGAELGGIFHLLEAGAPGN